MKGMPVRLMILSLLLALGAFAVRPAVADDETEAVKIKIKAPLDAVNCVAPATITLLGLTIDISLATFDVDEDSAILTCLDLVPGHVVEATLASDIVPLSALKIEAEDEGCDDEDCVEIEAPIQAIVLTFPQTITVLGLVVDISQAELEADDEDDTGTKPPVDLTQLIVGQFVEMELASNQLPLVATELEVKNFNNGVELVLLDSKGIEVNDDVGIDVSITTTIAPAGALSARTTNAATKVFKFHARSNGGIILHGLPTGSAKIVVTRLQGRSKKSAAKSSATIESHTIHQLPVQLKQSRK